MTTLASVASGCCSLGATGGCLTTDTLRRHGSRGEPDALVAYLDDERSWVREEAARTLGAIRAESAARALEARLLDPRERPWVRGAAAEALGAMESIASIRVIAGVLAEPGTAAELKLAAIRALCALASAGPEPLQLVTPLAADEDLLVAALAEDSVATKCGGRAR